MQRACARGTVVVAAGADAVWFGGMEGAGDAGALAGLCELLKMRQLTLSPFPFAHLCIVHARGRHERNRPQRKRSAAKTETEARGTTTVFAETPSKSGRPVRSIKCLKSDLTGIRYGVYITDITNNLTYRNHRRHSFFSSSWPIIDEWPVTNSPFAFRDIVLNGGPILPPGRLCLVRRQPLYLSTIQ